MSVKYYREVESTSGVGNPCTPNPLNKPLTMALYLYMHHTSSSNGSLLPGFGSVYDGMGRLNEQGLPRLKGEAVPHKQHQLEVAHVEIWRKYLKYTCTLSMNIICKNKE